MAQVSPSSLGKRSTAEEASAGIDLSGRVAVVTGANGGIGEETARVLALRGAHVIIAGRNKEQGEAVARAINEHVRARGSSGRAEVMRLDLASLQSVRQFADDFNAKNLPLHILVLNAGCWKGKQRETTADGFEATFGTNHLGHFLLANLLEGRLRSSAPARVVVLSSLLHKRGKMDFNNLMLETDYEPRKAYNNSKLANALFAIEFNRRLAGSGVVCNALHPGVIRTGLARNFNQCLVSVYFCLGAWWMKTVPQGAATSVFVATAPAYAARGGLYFGDCKEEEFAPQALDEGDQKRLWEVSERLVGLRR
eukprot:tig00020927_g15962.t1